ncbi:HK97 family phage major capsid protein [Xanthomonas arboricola]|uniref:phage major capsid protein n=1 Tax=Xanthomonas cannabis TaxID=1885674 RepID=UPI00185267B6|nr:phage major capsid protein [Xanthomonas cannabis]MBB3806409.1 HK97 family phage major capsid protein [Xanthomonas cannabis]
MKFTLWTATLVLAVLFTADAIAGTHFLALGPDGLAMASVAAALPEAISAELKKISDQVKAQAETAEKEIKAHARLSEETRASVDKLLTEQGALQARLQSAEQLVAKMELGGYGGDIQPKSMGDQVVENEEFKAWAARPSSKFHMDVKAVVTSDGASAGDLIVPDRRPGIIMPGQRRLTIRDLMNSVPTGSNAIEYVRESGYTNNAAPIAENPAGIKAESNITFEADSAPVVTIAHWIHASRQVLSDIPTLRGYIDGRLRYGLKFKEEAQLLKGSGVGLNLNGLVTQATDYANPGVTVQAETRLDRLRLALLQVELAEAWADGIVLSPIDWAAIELSKTDDNAYLFANPRGIATPALWGRNVVPTQAMDAAEFLVGAFGGGIAAEIHDREDVQVMVATQDDRDFVKNMVKVLMEERLTMTVYRPEAFVTGDFTGIGAPASGG